VDEVECWKIMWALVDDQPERLFETLHATNRALFPTVQLITYMHLHSDVQVDLDMLIDDFVSRNNRILEFSYTYGNEKH